MMAVPDWIMAGDNGSIDDVIQREFGFLNVTEKTREAYKAFLDGDYLTGNLFYVRAFYRRFQPSANDWQRGIRLPYPIDAGVARLLGLVWSRGIIKKSSNGEMNFINVQGRRFDTPLFEEFVAQAFSELFNLEKKVGEVAFRIPSEYQSANGNREVRRPYVAVASSAIAGFLINDLRIPLAHPHVRQRLPWLGRGVFAQNFFEGVLAGSGTFYNNHGRPAIQFNSINPAYTNSIADLLANLHVEPTVRICTNTSGNHSTKVTVYSGATQALLDRVDVLNPHHRRYLSERFSHTIPELSAFPA